MSEKLFALLFKQMSRFTFDAGVLGHGKDVVGAECDWSLLSFSAPPKKASTTEVSCIARATSDFHLTLNGATIDRVTHTRANFHTLFFGMPVGPPAKKRAMRVRGDLKKFVDSLDRHVIDVAKSKIDEWFNRTMSGDLVEEYYRGSTTSTPNLRFVVSGSLDDRLTLPGSLVNVTLLLEGVQFKSQYFTCVWKIVDLVEARDPFVEGDGFGFFPDDDEDPEEDDEVVDNALDAYPSFEERRDMIDAESARLSHLISQWESDAASCVSMAERARVVMNKLAVADSSSFAEAYEESTNF